MKLNLHIIKEDLVDIGLRGEVNASKWDLRLSFATATDGTGQLRGDRVYVLEAANLRFALSNAMEGLSIICVGKPDVQLSPTSAHTLLWTEASTSCTGLAERINERFAYYEDWLTKVNGLFAQNAPLRSIAEASITIFGKPIWMWDSLLQTVFHVIGSNDRKLPSGYRKHEDGTPWPAEEVNAINETFIESMGFTEPYILPPQFGYSALCYNLRDNGAYAATLAIDDVDGNGFTARDEVFIKLIGDMMALGFVYQPHFSKHASIEMSSMYERLLLGAAIPANTVGATLSKRGWSVRDYYVCIVTRPRKVERYSDYIMAPVAERICDALTNTLSAIVEGSMVFTVNRTNCSVSTAELEKILTQEFQNAHVELDVGISTQFNDFTLLPHFCEQARLGMQVGKSTDPDEAVFYFGDYLVDVALDSMTKDLPAESFYPPSLVRLMRYDDENDGDLVEVLGAYLKNGLSSNQTANELFIHRNTMLNRLKRIESVGGVNFADEDERLALQIAFALMKRK